MTPLDMATCAAVALPCGLAVVACVGWFIAENGKRFERRKSAAYRDHLSDLVGQHLAALSRAFNAEDRLRRIERQRSEATRKGNATRKALNDAKIEAKRLEIEAGLHGDSLERLVA